MGIERRQSVIHYSLKHNKELWYKDSHRNQYAKKSDMNRYLEKMYYQFNYVTTGILTCKSSVKVECYK